MHSQGFFAWKTVCRISAFPARKTVHRVRAFEEDQGLFITGLEEDCT